MNPPRQSDVDYALKRAGNYRVKQAQIIAYEGEPDQISGALLLALACRETWVQNLEGGGHYDSSGRWVNTREDKGAFQISTKYHEKFLDAVSAVRAGTWTPVVGGRTPMDLGFVPQFSTGCRYAVAVLQGGLAAAKDRRVPNEIKFAVSAYNAGAGGAWAGHRDHGDSDYYTSGRDYGAWVLECRSMVNNFLGRYPNWKVAAPS